MSLPDNAELAPVRLLPPADEPNLPAVVTPVDFTVSEEAEELHAEGRADATKAAYDRQQRLFREWCAGRRSALPCTSETLQTYVGHLMGLGRANTTITLAVSAIRDEHKEAKLPPPPIPWLKRMQTAHGKHRVDAGKKVRKARALSLADLSALMQVCPLDTLAGLRNRALILLGIAIMARRSELAALTIDDVRDDPNGIDVYIAKSKTDQAGHGTWTGVKYWANADACPVRLTQAWVHQLSTQGITTGRLFRRVDQHGHLDGSEGFAGRSGERPGIDGRAVGLILRSRAQCAGLPSISDLSAHSLRSGGATIARELGGDTVEIVRLGRWADGSKVALGYMQTVDRWRNHPLAGVRL